jgi:hypothetical protein
MMSLYICSEMTYADIGVRLLRIMSLYICRGGGSRRGGGGCFGRKLQMHETERRQVDAFLWDVDNACAVVV